MIGGGKMGEALVAGLLAGGWASTGELRVVERLADRAAELRDRFPGLDVGNEPGVAQGHVIAVKPGDVEAACRALAAASVTAGLATADPMAAASGGLPGGAAPGSGEGGGGGRGNSGGGGGGGSGSGGNGGSGPAPVLSIAAGATLARLEAALAPGTPVVRAMPNTPALVGAGAAAIAAGSAAGDGEVAWASSILGAVGTVVVVPESSLDAVTGLSGSGPAYVFLVVESLVEGGVLAGLPRDVASSLAVQTVLGSAQLLVSSSDGPEALRAAVTSPGGTTAAGLWALERGGVRAAFLEAVMAATERSRELGRSG